MKTSCILTAILAATIVRGESDALPPIRHISPDLQKAVAEADYKNVRIKAFPIGSEAWTFRKFTFAETVRKLKELGVTGVEAFPGQALGTEFPGAHFGEGMNETQVAFVKDLLKANGVTLYGYGVVDIGRTEKSMRRVFDFARKMGISVIVCEPADDDFTLLETLVKEYNIKIAIHNHPPPSKYNMPETVFKHVDGKDPRIGSCADNGHWMRGKNDPREAYRLLKGRILDAHFKDRTDVGTQGVKDVPWGSGAGRLRDLLAELTLQNYEGYLTMEYENDAEIGDPMPAFRKSIEFVKSVTDHAQVVELLPAGRALEAWQPVKGWQEVGGAGLDPKDEKRLTSVPGTGMIVSAGKAGYLVTKESFGDVAVHVEFMIPRNSNSGVLFMGSYEVQVLDSFRDAGVHYPGGECGGIYPEWVNNANVRGHSPLVNASLPPGQWQTYDVEFRAPRFDASGKKTANARFIKVVHNGKLVQDDVELFGPTRGGYAEKTTGPLRLQGDHGPVVYRVITIRPLTAP